MALRAAPKLPTPIRAHLSKAGVRFNIALMRRLGGIALLHHEIGLGKALFHIAVPKFDIAHHIRVHPFRDRVIRRPFADHRRALFHSVVDIGHMRQDLVFNLHRLGRIPRKPRRRRGDRRHRMAIIKCALSRHAVFHDVPVCALLPTGEIGARHHGLDPFHGKRLARVDPDDPRMGMRAAHDGAMKHPRRRSIRPIARLARDLIKPVGPVRPCADNAEFLLILIQGHHAPSRISCAASCTARMILS